MRTLATSCFVSTAMVFAVGCSSAQVEDDSLHSSLETQGAGAPIVLVATDEVVRARCAPELATTYCSESSARAAATRCDARLSADERASCGGAACTSFFSPTRDGACRESITYDTPRSCRTPVYDDCSFYRSCLDPARSCGEDGYALRFGERFCNTFMEEKHQFTPAGQTWLRSVRRCLQAELVHSLDDPPSCEALADTAFKTHARCYTDRADSICSLDGHDVKALLQLIELRPGQHLLRQMGEILRACTLSSL